jgi:hypothetical protein
VGEATSFGEERDTSGDQGSVEIQALKHCCLDIIVEKRVNLIDAISVNFQEAALALGRDNGTAGAINPWPPESVLPRTWLP